MPLVVLSSVWDFVKKHWQPIVIVILLIVCFIAFHHQSTSHADELKQVQNIHSQELDKIAVARAQEEQQHALNVKQLQDNLDEAQRQYDTAKRDLDSSKKAQAAAIVKQYGNDPVALAQKLSEVTGFRVVTP